MPLYLDIHRDLSGVTREDLIAAHLKDVAAQGKYGVCYHKYWWNTEAGRVFCLVEGPNREACDAVHREAHGLVADDLIEVDPKLLDAFMGASAPNQYGLVMAGQDVDPALRVILFTELANLAEVAHLANDAHALEILRQHDALIRDCLARHGGREIRHTGEGILASFTGVSAALRFGAEVQRHYATMPADESGYAPLLRIGITAGEPVERDQDLFGVSVRAARNICNAAFPGEVCVSAALREMAAGKGFRFSERGTVHVPDSDEKVGLFSLEDPHLPAPGIERSRVTRAVLTLSAELRRRRVLTVAAVYAGSLFLLLQIADLTFRPLGLPEWSFTLLLALGIFGFPLAVILTWIFDLTPTGIVRTRPKK
jgi:class 3 adenylate cyclase